MNLHIIFSLYGTGQPKQTAFYDSSRGDDDLRITYIVEYWL